MSLGRPTTLSQTERKARAEGCLGRPKGSQIPILQNPIHIGPVVENVMSADG